MTFTEGEELLVTQKDGEWWTGSIGERTGIFPSNYVRPKDQEVMLSALKQHSVVTNLTIANSETCGLGDAALIKRKLFSHPDLIGLFRVPVKRQDFIDWIERKP